MKTFLEFADQMSIRDFHKSIMDKGKMPPIDAEEYPDRKSEGLEGPFRFKDGRILYYDPKEGAYYDSKSDMFVPNDQIPQS